MPVRLSLAVVLVLWASSALAQWPDVRQLGIGGESTVASDGAGNIYVTSHLPCSLWQSHDWGETFQRTFRFPDSLGDMDVYLRPDHKVNIAYIRLQINGLSSWHSDDGGLTLSKGMNFNGPFDREWLTSNSAGDLFMDYSNGYIGGPKSKGLFLAKSTDDGQTFTQIARVDREKKGCYAVDPYIATNSRNRMFCMWATSTDYNTIDNFKLAYSDNGGCTFSKPQTVAEFPKALEGEKVDVQERWMLGDMLAVGPKKLVIVYPEYAKIQVDGKPEIAFLIYCKTSFDGGETFGKGEPAIPPDETIAAIRDFNRAKLGGDHPYYIQTLPWLCADPTGRVYLAYTDNRAGQTTYKGKVMNRWQVRCATCFNLHNGFTWSEQVSHVYQSHRPPQDFLSCTADSKMLYVSWTENPNVFEAWPADSFASFTGNLFVARKKLP